MVGAMSKGPGTVVIEEAKAVAQGSAGAVAKERADAVLCFGEAFRATVRSVIRLRGRDTHLGGAELSHAQLELLIELYERGELPAGELAAAARLSPATVTQMLDHLAAAGHVERVRSPEDRRVVVSRLTQEGRRLLIAKREAWNERWQLALAGVSERDLRAAARVLERVQALFERGEACEKNPLQEG